MFTSANPPNFELWVKSSLVFCDEASDDKYAQLLQEMEAERFDAAQRQASLLSSVFKP